MTPTPNPRPIRWLFLVLVACLAIAVSTVAIRAQEDVFLPLVTRPQATPTNATIPPTATPSPTATATGAPTATHTPTATPTRTPGGTGSSVRFFGNGRNAIDRVTIRIDGPARPADVGATDFTIEFWLKAEAGANGSNASCNQNDGWITGNVVFDRDIYFAGDYGDFGIALSGGKVAFGLSVDSDGTTLCGSRTVADNQWHHVAVTRRTNGAMAIFVDGQPDGSTTGAAGDASYRDGRGTGGNTWDPYIVLGAEKHDAGSAYPSFAGWLDELRLSNTVRYTAAFTPPASPFAPDGGTMALYHFDEGTGVSIADVSGAIGGPSSGELRVGGSPSGPVWSGESPF
jgi:hypothetical protein